MRRITVTHASAGLTLGLSAYDFRGQEVLRSGCQLDEESIRLLVSRGVADLFVEDARVADIVVGSLYPPALEARGVHALYQLLTTSAQRPRLLQPYEIHPVATFVEQMAACLFPMPLGDPDFSGSSSLQGYDYIHPVKVAMLGIYVGHRLGLRKRDLVRVGLAAILQNVGYLLLPAGLLDHADDIGPRWREVESHPILSANLVAKSGLDEGTVRAIEQHHERWDGGGYPDGLQGDEISFLAQIVGIADTYHALVSERPHRDAYAPGDAIDTILQEAGRSFSTELAEQFALGLPLYPPGVCVELSTGQAGIVAKANIGTIGRPIVRICIENGRPVRKPFDLDLSRPQWSGASVLRVVT